MTPSSLVKLIHSLSGPEKRFFRLQCKMQEGNKEYELLFRIIDTHKSTDIIALKQEFRKRSPKGSWENTCIYLGRMLIDCLVKAKKEKDVFFDLMHQMQEIRILNERSLEQQAIKQAKKVQQKAAQYQLHWIEYYCHRYELQYYSDNNFAGITDDALVKMQMKGKDILRNLNHIHDHYSLYELLHYRLMHTGRVVSEEDKKRLNDLMLSEMALVAGRTKSFASKKLHLLFQSFFFTVVGDYHSALKSFYHLNELMEKNESFLDNPPLDYLSALTGILDSLHMLNNHSEAPYYLDKIRKLDQGIYPEYFRYLVRKVHATRQITWLLHAGKTEEAKQLADGIAKDVFESYILVDEEKQCELYFYCSLACFRLGNWKKAHLFIREIMNQMKLPGYLPVSKAIRLLNIIIYFQKGEMLHLEYEIRAYKRYFRQLGLLRSEKLVFRIIANVSAHRSSALLAREQKNILKELDLLVKDRYEQQLLKYIDVRRWVYGNTLAGYLL